MQVKTIAMDKLQEVSNYECLLKRIKRENYLLVLMILFISAGANYLEIYFVTYIIVFLYAGALFIKRRMELQLTIVLFIGVYITSLLVYFINFGWIDVLLSIRMILIFVLGYAAIRLLQDDLFLIYEKIIYILATASLIFYPIQLLFYKELMAIVSFPQHVFPILQFTNGNGGNIFIFTLMEEAKIRNAGFAWEPKAFGNFLVIAIVSNLIRNRFKINKKLIVFIITALTTISTTAYLSLFFLIPLFYIKNMRKSYFVFSIPLIIIIMASVMQLDFMKKKMESEWKKRYDYKTLLADNRHFDARSLGRFPSMMVDFMDFEKKPIFGYGMQRSERTQSVFSKLERVNGLSNWLAAFGAVGFLFLILAHYFGFKKYLLQNGLDGAIILVLIIMVIYFASNLISYPFWITLQFLFVKNYNAENMAWQMNNQDINFSLN